MVLLILKTTVRLSHPAPMDLVLRKRISLSIYKRQSIAERLKKSKWLGRADFSLTQTGVTYEVVSNIPKASEELEDRESLAQLAASGEDNSACDGETYIGWYFSYFWFNIFYFVLLTFKLDMSAFNRKIHAWSVSS